MRSKAIFMALLALAFGAQVAFGSALDTAIKNAVDGGVVEISGNSVLEDSHTITNALTIRSSGGVFTVTPSSAANFTIGAGGSLTVSNVTFKDGTGMSDALFLVKGEGAQLTLGSGATIDGMVGSVQNYSAAVTVLKGTVTLGEGAQIVNCRAEGKQARGGGVSLGGAGCTLNLEGGEIRDCWASGLGGGIYAFAKSVINISGSVKVHGNESGGYPAADNLILANTDCSFNLVGETSGSVGVRWNGSNNAAGDAFIAVADAAAAAGSCAAFANDTSGDLHAVVSSNRTHLVWTAQPVDPGEVFDPESPDARVAVIYNDGTAWAETHYYKSFAYAWDALTNDATVVVRKAGETVSANVEVTRKVLLRADVSAGTTGLSRSGDYRFTVEAGGALTLTNIVMSGENGGTLLQVNEGGFLTLDDGAVVRDVHGDRNRAAGGILVFSGTFRMRSGSKICNCGNDYPKNTGGVAPANVGVGGGLLVDVHGTAYLEGGTVERCWAERAGGVYVGNQSTVYVSGDVVITGNSNNAGKPSDLTVEDKSLLVLTDEFTGSIGVRDGVLCDTNVIGRVDSDCPRPIPDLVASAARFFRDDRSAVTGLIVTNADTALLVWWTAVDADGIYRDRDGNEYAVVEYPPEPPERIPVDAPVAIAGLVYNGKGQVGVVAAAAGYLLDGNVATNAGDYTATARLSWGYKWSDGSRDPREIEWSIAKATYDMSKVGFFDAGFQYDGTPKSIFIKGTLPSGVTTEYEGNGQTEIGEYTVTAHFAGDAANYNAIADKTAKLTISSEKPDPPPPAPTKVNPPTAVEGLVYNGQEQKGVVPATGYSVTDGAKVDAGDYTAVATPLPNYIWSDDGTANPREIEWSIAKATYDMSGVVFTNVTYVADGTPKSARVDETTLPTGVSVTNYLNNGQTEVGDYTVTAQFGGDEVNYEPIADKTAKLTITEAPTPPPGPTPQWEVVTNHPTPIAFKSIERVSDTEWTLVITDRVEYCNYRLIWTEDLTSGFTETGKWEHAVGPAAEPVWTTNVITTGGAWFWRAEGADGTNMVPPSVEK